MLIAGGHAEHLVTLWIESDGADVRPLARVARPALWVALPGLGGERVSSREDGLIIASVALLRADVADATVAVVSNFSMIFSGTSFTDSVFH